MIANAYVKADRISVSRKVFFFQNTMIFMLVVACLGLGLSLKSARVAFDGMHQKYLSGGRPLYLAPSAI